MSDPPSNTFHARSFVGFTNGIAVLIASTQLRDFFGLQIAGVPDEFIGRMRAVISNFHTLSVLATIVGSMTLGIVVLAPRVRVTGKLIEEGRVHSLQGLKIPAYAAVYRIHGPFLFGATDKLDQIVDHLDSLPPIVIVRLRHVPAVDASGLQALEDLADQLTNSGRTLLLCGAREQPAHLMERAEFHQHVGDANILANVQDALRRAEQIANELGLEEKFQGELVPIPPRHSAHRGTEN